ncbi:MAG: hypothetical protein AAF631_03845 [Pseudomonadota bacterium]
MIWLKGFNLPLFVYFEGSYTVERPLLSRRTRPGATRFNQPGKSRRHLAHRGFYGDVSAGGRRRLPAAAIHQRGILRGALVKKPKQIRRHQLDLVS